MKQVSTIGLDPAKKVFQVHGVARRGAVTVRRTLRRRRVLLLAMRDIATGGQRHGTMMSRFGRILVKTLRPHAAHERVFHKTLELTKEGDYDRAPTRG